jgi:outer membrane murein-binding lipoprotein Lpp
MVKRLSRRRDRVVNQRTGVVDTASEYVENLRALERAVQRLDDDIAIMHADLKAAKEAREKAVAQMRSAIREGTVLPLLELDAETTSGDPTRPSP